ncbi:MAG: glutamine-hydrolyzing carbamoyl-phosphate synthase small subunit [Myxococcales bacterium]|nr:glutamine-hydrolyzing carbamoyl-phosphate synthase small subunit [Myxococcales bacterium]MCB9531061.1 glutamine-hydrolyzing carbamoyl-phosphate synthase small subunit [Myxococcales bacterium]MCB9532971.1 glutamine-hydrolyzing carbamoyl-phosphate synthase small subunit [Myxococcales bacterium]
MVRTPCMLVLADGSWFSGDAFGAAREAVGEVVFNTSMSGYQEILTDPSYRGQIVTMTSPHIGNYGVNELDVESDGVQVAALVVREVSRARSNYRSTATLPEYLAAAGVPAITGIDTRALTRRIRDEGTIMGVVAVGATPADAERLAAQVRSAPAYESYDYVAGCSVRAPMIVRLRETGDVYCPTVASMVPASEGWTAAEASAPLVVVVDFGVKRSILRMLAAQGLRVLVVPHDTPAAEVLQREPAGVLLSNGPGDPGRMDTAVATVQGLLGATPLFGICLGHQLLGRALGGETFKLKFGHRGPNQPVKDAATGRVEITSQNHGFAVRLDGSASDIQVSYSNLNDGTVEGLSVPRLRAFSVQHHPEAGPGPHDASIMFERFRAVVSAT